MFCCSAEANFSILNLLELESYGKFDFSRPDLDGKKPAKGKCLARKVEIEKCLSSGTEGSQFFFFCIERVSNQRHLVIKTNPASILCLHTCVCHKNIKVMQVFQNFNLDSILLLFMTNSNPHYYLYSLVPFNEIFLYYPFQ